jgi:hypothetical protein
MNRKRKLILTAALVVFLICVLYFLLQGGMEEIHYGAICGKCLQQADFQVKKILGITYYQKCTFVRGESILMSPSSTNSPMEDCDPNLYEKIFGQRCEHCFKKGAFGRTEIFFFSELHSDGAFTEWFSCEKRLKGISSVYRIYGLMEDTEQARNSYRIIDVLHPVGERQPRAAQILQMYVDELEEVTGLERWKRTNKEYYKMLQLESTAP